MLTDDMKEQLLSWHRILCSVVRRFEVNLPNMPCAWCKEKFSSHDHDGRCSHGISLKYVRADAEKVDAAGKTLKLLEEIARLNKVEM